MNQASLRRIANAGLLSLGVAALGACSAESPAAPTGEVPSFGFIPGGTGTATTNAVAGETFKVCKVYVGADGGPVTVRVQVDEGNNGPGTGDEDFNVSVAGGTCVAVWSTGGNAGSTDLVTVTETGPAGYTTTLVKQTVEDGAVTTGSSVISLTASNTITNPGGTGIDGVVVTFTNTEDEADPLPGRMTGGGAKVVSTTGETVTFGLTLHCDLTLSNNLEINWGGGQKWHLSKPITDAVCTDEGLSQPPPVAPFDTFTGEGFGKLNGVAGSRIEFVFGDAGEPGKNDLAGFKIFGPNGGPLVLEVVYQKLKVGNLQAHYDQPHGNKP